jgi:putative tryptophan/tyrosine transport system substrate-binding protein
VNRRAFLGVIVGGMIAGPLAAAQHYRIGYLSSGSPRASPHLLAAFRQRLGELGWVEGKKITIDYRFAEGQFDRLPDLVAELVRLNVDI